MIDFDSVVEGSDADWFPGAVRFYTGLSDPLVLDVTWGAGRFWQKNEGLRVVGLDILPSAEVQADHHQLPICPESVDVVVYDPPHILRNVDVGEFRQSVHHLYNLALAPNTCRFFYEAARVLHPGGVVIAKLSDEVSKGRWLTIDAFHAAKDAGLTPFDVVIKKRGRAIINRSQKQHRARKCHCFYWIYKKP
jgi:SAM-dependent methyltransferase